MSVWYFFYFLWSVDVSSWGAKLSILVGFPKWFAMSMSSRPENFPRAQSPDACVSGDQWSRPLEGGRRDSWSWAGGERGLGTNWRERGVSDPKWVVASPVSEPLLVTEFDLIFECRSLTKCKPLDSTETYNYAVWRLAICGALCRAEV